MIKINNLDKYFNKGKSNQIHVINDTQLNLPSTGLVALLGDSGAGKTTLLNVIGGLDRFDKGSIEYDDVKFNKYSMGSVDKFRGENIGYIFQHYNLLPYRTVYDNLALQLDLIGITDDNEVNERIKYALNAVGLYKFRKKLAGQLSGGQMQRVAIARALVKKTKILIADEPTGNLDSKNSVEIMNILKKISGIALVLLVTHDKPLAEYYADTIVDLKDGKVTGIREIHNTDSTAIKNRLDYKVYLGDMKKIEDGEKVKSVVYTNEESPEINLTLVEINGTYYIKSNVLIKDISEANVELVEGKYEDSIDTQIEDKFNFDNSWYNDTKAPHPFKRMWFELKEAYISLKAMNRRAKILKRVLVIIGIILAYAFISLYSYNHVSTKGILRDNDAYYINGSDLIKLNSRLDTDKLTEAKVSIGQIVGYDFYYHKNSYVDYEEVYDAFTFWYSSIEDKGLEYGAAPSNYREIVIGKHLADRLLKALKVDSYERLKFVSANSYTIVGVSKANTDAVYKYSAGETSLSKAAYINSYAEYETYEVLKGEDCKTSTLTNPILKVVNHLEYQDIEDGDFPENDYIGQTVVKSINGVDKEFTISGVCAYLDKDGNYLFVDGYKETTRNVSGFFNITYEDAYIFPNLSDSIGAYKDENGTTYNGTMLLERGYDYASAKDGIEIISGSLKKQVSSSYAGALVPYYSGLNVGDGVYDYNGNYFVVTGIYKNKYSGSSIPAESLVLNTIDYYLTNKYISSYDDYVIEISDDDKDLLSDIVELDKTVYQADYEKTKKLSQTANKTSLILAGVLTAVCAVYIYFTMRAHMISDIYEIGVLRNIGASRRRIVSKYAIQSLVSIGTSAIEGYVLFVLIFGGINQYIQRLLGNDYNLLGSIYPFYGLISLIAIALIFGTLPIFTLLGKTPSEISAKYDI